jgi:serine/threonine protein kinase
MSFLREPDAEPLPGYRLIELIGTGGFGEVWKCEVPGGLIKAIKFVYGNLNSVDGDSVRAEQEFGALNRIKEVRHPFILSMERIENVEGELAIVMELADKNLHDAFNECQAAGLVGIPREDLLRYLRDAAEGLDHLIVKYNLQHLDVKPRNLFLISDRVKVADFGLVKHIERHSGVLSSITPLYAAPETFTGKISEHSDQYSLAIVYQELLTGHRPFSGKNARQLALQHCNEEPELRSLPESERPIVARALSKNPAKRFPNCLSFVRALYTAARLPRATAGQAPVDTGNGSPHVTMADTMEDIHLKEGAAKESEELSFDVEAPAEGAASISRLGLTVSLPETGALRPTLIIGLGGFGRKAIVEIRCRFLDRFGSLDKIPLVHFLYADVDPEAIRTAMSGAPEVACTSSEVCQLALQPIGNYRRRMLDQLSEWLPREKLYALPRSLQTQGSRALGRLAFADNHLRFMARMRREIQQICHPDTLYESVSETGLALRDNQPRIYVIAAAGGGASGALVDLGYSLRRLLHQLRFPQAEITTLLFCGAPEDPATPRSEQANIFATLTELNHFADPIIPFAAQYGPDGPRTRDTGPPYDRVYLLKAAHRGPGSLRDAVAHLGSYLFHELTTPLGLRLNRTHRPEAGNGCTLFRSFGTHAVWFPRGLLLRLAARQACVKLLKEWQADMPSAPQPEVEAACARALADTELRFDALCASIQNSAAATLEGNLAGSITAVLSSLEEQAQQSVAQDDPGNWARQAYLRIEEWVGASLSTEENNSWRKSRISRALGTAVQQVASFWDQQLSATAYQLMESPGSRVGAAEAALNMFMQFCQDAAQAPTSQLEVQMVRTQQAGHQLERALENCLEGTGGFSLFGGRSHRLLRVFMDHLAAFSRQRLMEEVISAGIQFYAALHSRLSGRLRDLSFCRQRLRHLQENLQLPPEAATNNGANVALALGIEAGSSNSPPPSALAYWDGLRDSQTARLVLPGGEEDLERAALRFLGTLKVEQWSLLDQALQDRVLTPLGGIHKMCFGSGGDLARSLANPLVNAASTCLSEHLPITDVTQVEFSATSVQKADLPSRIKAYFDSAAPLVGNQEPNQQRAFLLVPTSDAGKEYGDMARAVLPSLQLVKVPGQADLMFCREQESVTPEEVQRSFRPCRQAYEEAAVFPNTSPHARFDITDWIPLDP